MGQKRDFGRFGRMFFPAATPSLWNFIITRERDVGVAALILSEAFDIMAQRDLKGDLGKTICQGGSFLVSVHDFRELRTNQADDSSRRFPRQAYAPG